LINTDNEQNMICSAPLNCPDENHKYLKLTKK